MHHHKTTRRALLRRGVLVLGGAVASSLLAADATRKPAVSLGLLTDLHYADKPEAGSRFYRETADKLTEAVTAFNREKLASVVCLGDFIDQAQSVDEEIAWLQRVEKVFARAKAPRHYVLGNHCVGTLTKAEFAAHTAANRSPHYSFDLGRTHFIVLDACYRHDGQAYGRKNFDWTDSNIPPQELEWLRGDLAKTTLPTVVFVHQRLDDAAKHSVRNAAEVRAELERNENVLAVFQGHSHRNDYQQIAGIHYCTLVAMVEGSGAGNNGYAVMEIMDDSSIRVRGFRRQQERQF
ncbi:MAG: metallophosphoesterase [Chthoniobacteraceae bacterium]